MGKIQKKISENSNYQPKRTKQGNFYFSWQLQIWKMINLLCLYAYYSIIRHMQQDHKDQLTYYRMKQRQIAQHYLHIQQNTELLTQLIRFNFKSIRNAIDFNSLIDIKSIICLIVQKAYLVYVAYLKKINILVSLQIYGKSTTSLPEAYCQYLLEVDRCRYSNKQQDYIRKQFILIDVNNSHRKLIQYLCKFIIDSKRNLRITFQKIKSGIEGQIIIKQFEKLQQMMQNIILPQIHKVSPKALILCLEQSELFRDYSLLTKCLNNSIFTRIRFHSRSKQIFQNLVQLESNLFAQSKNDHKLELRLMQTTIQETVSLLLKNNIIGFEQSLNKLEKKEGEQKESIEPEKDNKSIQRNTQLKPFLLGNISYLEKVSKWRYSIKFNITQKPFKPFTAIKFQSILRRLQKPNSVQLEEQPENNQQQKQYQQYPIHLQQFLAQRQRKQDYIIEFTSGKNLLSIKYITNLEMTIENADILMFQCNYLTNIWSNVSLQFIQKQNRRFLAFKLVTYLHNKERFVLKMLTMIDLLLVYSKATTEYFLRRNVNEEHQEKTIELSRQCEHLKKIFIAKIEKNYSALQNSLLKL